MHHGEARGHEPRRHADHAPRSTCRSCAMASKPEGESALYYTYTGVVLFTEQDKSRRSSSRRSRRTSPSRRRRARTVVGMISITSSPPGHPRRASNEVPCAHRRQDLYSIGMLELLRGIAPQSSVDIMDSCMLARRTSMHWRSGAGAGPGRGLRRLDLPAKPIFLAAEFLHRIVGNWGWAIVLLTVIIKAAFSSAVGRQLQVDGAHEGSDAADYEAARAVRRRQGLKLNAAMMELYKNEKIICSAAACRSWCRSGVRFRFTGCCWPAS